MSFRSDSLHDRLTQEQRHELMIFITDAGQNPAIKDRFKSGLDLCTKWGIKTSRTSVYDFFRRYNFGWRLELGAWAAKHTEGMSSFDKESRLLTAQKLFAQIADSECPVKYLIMIRSLQLEQDKVNQKNEALEHSKEKFRESLRTKLDAGMNALFEQIKNNPKALEAFKAMKAAIAK